MKISSLLTVLVIVVLVLSACSSVQVTPAQAIPTFIPLTAATPAPTATPEPTGTPTLSPQDAAIEAEWLVQKPKIDAAITEVFNEKVTDPWLSPAFNDANLVVPDSPVAHCMAMDMWGNYIPLQSPLPGCQSGHNPIKDFFGIAIRLPGESGTDNLEMKIFPYMPIPYCDGVNPCGLLPGPGGAYYGMTIGRYKIVTYCGKPANSVFNLGGVQLLPYLKDPVSMILFSTDGLGYVQIIANRGAWFSYGTLSGKGWDESFRFCPSF